jgi:hypothetical protein
VSFLLAHRPAVRNHEEGPDQRHNHLQNRETAMKVLHRVTLLLLPLQACSAGDSIDPEHWSCESLIGPVIEMSKGKTPEILEITQPLQMPSFRNNSIRCVGSAEWSEGEGRIEYGAHVSDGGKLFLSYQQL